MIDILNFKIVKSKKFENNLSKLIDLYKNKPIPNMPIAADILMMKFKIPEGKQLGIKLKMIEEEWVKNNFQISDQEVERIIND